MVTAGEVTVGRSTWRDLLRVTVECFGCGYAGRVRGRAPAQGAALTLRLPARRAL